MDGTQSLMGSFVRTSGGGGGGAGAAEVTTLRAAAAAAEEQSTRMQVELTATQARVRTLEQENSTLRAERDMYLDQIAAAHAQLNALGAALDQVKASGGVDAAAYPCLAELVHDARQSTGAQTSQAEGLTPVKRGARGVRGAAAADMETAVSTIQQLETRLSVAQSRLSQREEALSAAQEDLARDELIFRQRMAELHSLRQALRQAEADMATLKERHAAQMKALEADHARQLAAAAAGFGGGGGGGDAAEVSDGDGGCDDNDSDAEADAGVSVQARERAREREAAAEKAEEASFGRTQRDMQSQLADLAANIDEKSRLIDELQANEAHAMQLNSQYAARTAALEAEVQQREQALAELKAELDAVEEDKAKSEEEKRKMRDAYEERMRKMTMQVAALKRQQGQQDAARLEKVRVRNMASCTDRCHGPLR
jgi:chromosome segregation ATPase